MTRTPASRQSLAVVVALFMLAPSVIVLGANDASAAGGPAPATAASTGANHACALLANGNIPCWGYNGYGQAAAYSGGNAIAVSASAGNTCAALSNGNVQCWGWNDYGQSAGYSGGNAVNVSAGAYHTCALLSNGNIQCWGYNGYGQTSAYSGGNAIAISLGWGHTCALLSSGNVQCWGNNLYGQVASYSGGNAIGVSAGEWNTCVLLSNGNVQCWGDNSNGQSAGYSGGNATGLDAGQYHTCVLLSNGNVQCWGNNGNGRAAAYSGGNAIAVSAGGGQTCALLSNGNVHCWGNNSFGQSAGYFQIPAAPTVVCASAVNTTVMSLSWSSAALATGYSIWQDTISHAATTPMNTSGYSYAGHVDGTSVTISGLSPGTTYHFRVAGTNNGGEGPASDDATATTHPGIELLQPTCGRTYGANNASTYATTATAAVTSAPGSISQVEFRSGSTTGPILASVTSEPWQAELTFGVGPATLCAVAVLAASTNASCTTFTVQPSQPGAPANLQALPGSGQVLLSWSAATPAAGHPVSEYRVFRGEGSGGPYKPIGATTGLAYTDTGLTTGTYSYVVRAVTAGNNEGPASNEASAPVGGASTLTDGFTLAAYQPESPTGNTPFAGVAPKAPFPAGDRRPSVDLANGELVMTFPILHVDEHQGDDFDFAVTHRSIGNANGNANLAPRWDANWLQSLEASGSDYLLHTGDGRVLRFASVSGAWEGPPGSYSQITTSGSFLELKDRYGNRRAFDPAQGLKLTDAFDAAGNHWAFAYASGRLQSVTDPAGRVATLAYDANDKLTSVTDWAGRTSRLQYDGTGHLVATKTPSPTAGAPLVTRFEYDANDRLVAIRDPLDTYYARIDYDATGRVVAQRAATGSDSYFQYYYGSGVTFVRDANGNKVEWRFLPEGATTPRAVPSAKIEHTRGLRATDPASYTTTYAHNAQDETTSLTLPAGNSITYAYDGASPSFFARGNLLTETSSPGIVPPSLLQSSSQTSITTRYTYDPVCNRPVTIVDPRGTDGSFTPPNGGARTEARYTTTITYNGACKPLAITHPTVNPAGVPNAAFTSAYANQAIVESYTYNAAGQVLTHTDAAGVVESRTYYASPSTPGKPAGYLQSVTVDPGASPQLALTTTYEYTDYGVVNKTTDPEGNVRTSTVDPRGRITQETSPLGERTIRAYDANDNLVTLQREKTPGSGTYVSKEFTYDGLDRKASETSRSSPTHAITTRFAYDGNGNLLQRIGGAGEVQSSAYDERNLLLSKSGPSGGTYAYDANGNLQSSTDQNQRTTSFQYDGYDRLAVRTDAMQSKFVTSYDPTGNVVRERGIGGTSGKILYDRAFVHDEANRAYQRQEWMESADTMTTAGGTTGRFVTTLREYDARDHVTRTINDNGHVLATAYDAAGRPTTTTDPVGNVAQNTYDKNGNLVQTTQTIAGATTASCPQACTTQYTYDAEDRLTTTTNPDGTTRTSAYDGRGNVVQTTDEASNVILYTYDDADRLVQTRRSLNTTPATYVTTNTNWDDENRVSSQCDDAAACTTYTYLPATTLVVAETPPAGPSVMNTYDAAGNVKTVAYSSGKIVDLTYDALNRLVRVNFANPPVGYSGTTTQTFTYDDMSRVTQATDNGVGILGSGVATRLGQITATQQFDTLGRVIQEAQLGLPVTHTRDGVGNVLSTAYPSPDGRVVSRSYDANERLDRAWDAKGLIAGYSYRGSLVSGKEFGGPAPTPPATGATSPVAKSLVTYDGILRPGTIVHENAAGTLVFANLTTRYDTVGNRAAQKLQGIGSTDQNSQLYALDALFRTTSWKQGSISGALDDVPSPVQNASWPSINGKNDWLTWSVGAATCTRTTSTTPTRTVTDSCSDPSLSRTYTFDANGNLASDGTFTYRWDFLNRLTRVDDASGNLVVAYAYDAFDRRVAKVFPDNIPAIGNAQATREGWYTFTGQHVLQESQPVGGVLPNILKGKPPTVHVLRQWTYGPGVDEVLVMDWDASEDGRTTIGPGDQRYAYAYDSAGNVLGLVSETGHLVEGYAYQPYGQPTILTPATGAVDVKWDGTDNVSTGTYGTDPTPRPYSPSGNLWFFTGRQYDPEVGLYNYRARHYHPTLGQFMSLDPIGTWGDPANLGNSYAYVGNNPGSWNDPSGLLTWGDVRWGAGRFGTAVAAFVPCDCTNWAREDVVRTYENFHTHTEVPAAVRIGAEIFGPPQTKTDAVLAIGFAAIPGGKATAGLKVASKADDSAEFLLHWGRMAADEGDAFRDATKWGRQGGLRTTIVGNSEDVARTVADSGGDSMRYMRVPPEVWGKLTHAEKWQLNERFLENTLRRHDSVEAVTNPLAKDLGPLFRKELDYLSARGVPLNFNGQLLHPPMWGTP